MKSQEQNLNLKRISQLVSIVFLFMLIGTVLELYLLGHYEDTLQLVPILCIALSLIFMVALVFTKTLILFRAFKLVLVLTALSGLYGTYLHLQSNFEFEYDMTPTATNWELFLESLSGALPALAPLSMVVLALIGYTYLLITKQKL
ncbi:hypothetical protein [Psychroserpens sp.]|uniref:hypothetical protein n=1 Tax=Psychroserpens sp. TaxID=2020870 RepID=UPI001B12F667|nr:hypothetical protein [Psychroserpens sp.]MBO6606107.1 hypothetical protein [Psychroserpens sp.]MBO6630615.1 hypothetical protein [Psychroserpens sp.]MBO6652522.1 hypothetical protein [Psychroserpens sp.]MBO6681706.1 hypothetical protein [Psychroserpens sp.]MBO6749481.1 hypothetical protein [Psychroserpens sp.]